MKNYQVNVRTNNCLENLKLYANSEKEAIKATKECYEGYCSMKFIKSFKIVSVYEL